MICIGNWSVPFCCQVALPSQNKPCRAAVGCVEHHCIFTNSYHNLVCLDSVLQELQFAVGRYCCARLQMYHALVHYKHRLRGKLKKHIKHAYNMQKVTCHHAHMLQRRLAYIASYPMNLFLVFGLMSALTMFISGCCRGEPGGGPLDFFTPAPARMLAECWLGLWEGSLTGAPRFAPAAASYQHTDR